MRSIRRTIAIWTLPGIALLWLASAASVFIAARAAMLASIDRDNLAYAREVRASAMNRGAGGRRRATEPGLSVMPAAEGLYFQVWTPEGRPLARSDSLGERELSVTEMRGGPIGAATVELPGGPRARLYVTRFGTGHGGAGPGRNAGDRPAPNQPMTVAVARDLSAFATRSTRVLAALAATGALAIVLTSGLLAFGLRKGLRPLDALAEKAASINPESLHERFGDARVPRELEPIVRRLDSLMARIEDGFERERRFSSDLAHELRTPLAEIRLKMDLALRWPQERTDGLFEEVRKVADRIERIVDTLLQLARIEAGGGGFARKQVALATVIGEAWKPLEARAGERGLVAAIDWPEDATVAGDAALWRSIIGNLLANAVEYAPPGGRVTVARIEGGVQVGNSVAADFDPEAVGHLFERFWRADGARSDGGHCGLGLAVVRACAEGMGCTVEAVLRGDFGGGPGVVVEVRAA